MVSRRQRTVLVRGRFARLRQLSQRASALSRRWRPRVARCHPALRSQEICVRALATPAWPIPHQAIPKLQKRPPGDRPTLKFPPYRLRLRQLLFRRSVSQKAQDAMERRLRLECRESQHILGQGVTSALHRSSLGQWAAEPLTWSWVEGLKHGSE